MDPQQTRQSIQRWKKESGLIVSPFGDIKLTEQIGEGGTAVVFASEFAGGSAVKFLTEAMDSTSLGKSTRYQRFIAEYINLVKLVPTGAVVPLYYYGVQDIGGDVFVPYIVMERCKHTLQEAYKDDSLETEEDFIELIDRLLTVIRTLHDSDIVHRDIKPQNILLRPNGEWVLADFGIAWFDPDTFKHQAKTKNSDRLAKYGFSPPEQWRRGAYEKATPDMDLFALGQTLYYCVTGHTIRGANHSPFSEVAPQLAKFDPLIERLVSQNPSDRLQSVQDVEAYLTKLNKGDDPDLARIRRLNDEQDQQVDAFDKLLRQGIPGAGSFRQAKGDAEKHRVLTLLTQNVQPCSLTWIKGSSNVPIKSMQQLTEEVWLVNRDEWKAVDLWVHRDIYGLDRQYVIVHLAALPPFGIHNVDESTRVDTAGYFQGDYISFDEFYDGYAEIGGEVIELTDAEQRNRNTQDEFIMLAPQHSVYTGRSNRRTMECVYQKILEGGKIEISTLELLSNCVRESWMTFFD